MKQLRLLSIAITTSALTLSLLTNAHAQEKFSTDQVKQVKEIVHDYLVTNPDVLVEASQALQKRQMDKAEKSAKSAVVKNAKELFNNPNSPILGNPKGTVSIVEFMDYQCVHCQEMVPIIKSLLNKNNYLRVVVKELPIFGETSVLASTAALAAQKQGDDKFAAFHEALFKSLAKSNQKISESMIIDIAKQVGLNIDKLKTDMNDKSIKQELQNNFKLAEALGLAGTPAFVISNKQGNQNAFVPGTVTQSAMQKLIDSVKS